MMHKKSVYRYNMNTPQNTEMIKIKKMKEENMDYLKTIKNKIVNNMIIV